MPEKGYHHNVLPHYKIKHTRCAFQNTKHSDQGPDKQALGLGSETEAFQIEPLTIFQVDGNLH